jgi:acetone carboxylase gamma subunit
MIGEKFIDVRARWKLKV